MDKIKPRTLSGFMELLPAPQQQMERFMEILRQTYSLYGFTPLDTPIIEDAQILLAKGGGETEKQEERHFIESYTISLVKGFAGDSISLFVNDSLISNKTISEEPYTVEVGRFAEQSALLIVDNNTELVSTFDLSEKGGAYQFEKESDGIKQLDK